MLYVPYFLQSLAYPYPVHCAIAAICPDGQFVTGKGSRFIMAGTKRLHEKVDVLSDRIRALESGLEQLQSTISSEKHPLLADDLLKIKSHQDLLDDPEGKAGANAAAASTSAESGGGVPGDASSSRIDLTDIDEGESDNEGARVTSGTLTIRAGGTSTYFGSTARAEVRVFSSFIRVPILTEITL